MQFRVPLSHKVSGRSLLTVVGAQRPLVPPRVRLQMARRWHGRLWSARMDSRSSGAQTVEVLMPTQRERVPVRTIAVTIGMVLATAAILLLGWEVRRVLTWIVVAALLSIILGPVTDLVGRRRP